MPCCCRAFLPTSWAARLSHDLDQPTGSGHCDKCDFVYPDACLIVETDGRGPHTRDAQFEEDRRRDSILKLGGWEVIRFTWLQVVKQPDWVASTVRRFREMRMR